MAVLINRVYTGIGDEGTTRLAGGQELSKTAPRIEAYGTIDELNAVIGVLVEEALRKRAELDDIRRAQEELFIRALRRIQNELFDLGGELATLPEDRHEKQPIISESDVKTLESEMDEVNAHLPALRSFVLPGGGMVSALAHQARTVCRRAERFIVALHQASTLRPEVLRYVNRLSDWLFVMGRAAAVRHHHQEVLWIPGARDRMPPE